MLLLFVIGVFLIMLCAAKVLRRHPTQRCAVLLVASALPAADLERALYKFARRCTADYRHWYLYICSGALPMLSMLAGRLGFSLLSAGECRRLRHSQEHQFYFLSASGVLYRLPDDPAGDWQRLFRI